MMYATTMSEAADAMTFNSIVEIHSLNYALAGARKIIPFNSIVEIQPQCNF